MHLFSQPKQNAKAVAGRARKEEAANAKAAKQAADNEAKEAEKWEKGAKGKSAKEDKSAAAEAARAKKLERERLLAEEEASLPSKPKAAPKAGAKKAPLKAPSIPSFDAGLSDSAASFSASGVDDALDALSLVNAKTDKASVGSQAAKIETHPERRFKAAFEAYKVHPDGCLPVIPITDHFFSPQNPFNQAHMAHNASKDDKVAALQAQKEQIAKRLADK
ncbi:coiled-coil domain-containing protein [Rhodotorula toruloides]|uniref:Coiled-coil domain-containing protein n=1 Tax=Rhodotorula toruloides TaxID=5286 RepID=A0A511KF88_RHOTO|nr:coiled-coil domain-containing protein [Rhodotorula toruloides]